MRIVDFLVIFLIVVLIYVNFGGGGKNKSLMEQLQSLFSERPAAPVHKVNSYFNEGLPEDFTESNINNYTSRQKLIDDLKFREMKLHTIMRDEKEKFQRGQDANDAEKYAELMRKHQRASAEFKAMEENRLKEYEIVIKEQESSRSKGLR